MAKSKSGSPGSRPDLSTILGLLLAVGAILGGLLLEGGKVQDVSQYTAALIVFGGTIGAVMVTSPLSVVMSAAKRMGIVFFEKPEPFAQTLDEIVEYAGQARKQGIVSLEQQATNTKDPFLGKALNLAVDGIEMGQIRHIMELEIEILEQRREAEAKVFDAAGGYAPTVGIIGAVMGLIQVMKNLANIDEVGKGIAVAFVATVYGVASANLLFLPAASKLRTRIKEAVRIREMMLEGVLSIVEGMNPKLIRTKLEAHLDKPASAKAKASESGSRVASPVSAEG